MNIPWILVKGGPVMIPIILASVLGLAIIIDRLRALARARFDSEAFTASVVAKVRSGKTEEALGMCEEMSRYPIGSTLKAGLESFIRRKADSHEVEKAMERAGNREINALERYIGGLISVIGIEPLLGFLGTITGLIRAFMAWEKAGSNITVSQLASGIYEAMITTAAGLIVAVPYYLVCNYIVSRIKYISYELSDCSMQLSDAISESRVRK
jgi:biopolymer transport protein ExbB